MKLQKKLNPEELIILEKKYKEAFNDAERIDLRYIPFISIDNAKALTLEDAVFVLPNNKTNGHTFFAAITDITSFVHKNSELDKMAFLNPFSSKMIPEEVRIKFGTFKKGIEQVCMVAQIELTKQGKIISYDFLKATCALQNTLSFDDVSNIINNKARRSYESLTVYTVKTLHALAHHIRNTRFFLGKKFLSLTVEKNLTSTFKLPPEEVLKTFMTLVNVCAARFTTDWSKITMIRSVPEVVKKTYSISFMNSKTEKTSLKYCDFTSPLRRYAGIVIHRIIKTIITKNYSQKYNRKELELINEKLLKKKK